MADQNPRCRAKNTQARVRVLTKEIPKQSLVGFSQRRFIRTATRDVPSCSVISCHSREPGNYETHNVGALIIRIGFWGILYCIYN